MKQKRNYILGITQHDGLDIMGSFVVEKYQAPPAWIRAAGLEEWYVSMFGRKLLARHGPFKNLIVSSTDTGRNRILDVLVGVDTTHQLEIDEAQLGDDTTAVSDSDTSLGNALKTGINVADQSLPETNTGRLEFFIADANLSDDDYNEIGLFANGTMMARSVLDQTYTKSTGEDTKIVYDISLSAS